MSQVSLANILPAGPPPPLAIMSLCVGEKLMANNGNGEKCNWWPDFDRVALNMSPVAARPLVADGDYHHYMRPCQHPPPIHQLS